MGFQNKRICYLVLFIVVFYHCQIQTTGSEPKENKLSQKLETRDLSSSPISETKELTCPIPLTMGKVYGTGLSKFDQTQILSELKVLLGDLCEKKFDHLVSLIHPNLGLYVDAKGYWTIEDVKKDLKDPNGYFQVYYFDSEKLDQKKGSSGNLTVRAVFAFTKQVFVDIYVASIEEVEIKFRFEENPKLERYLINPSFMKSEGNWYLLRMF
ncbi:hypothetical protein ND861_06980 [Leptospira sp. 2 VSF19]|uniref:Lipoprotein n=1 Tax=Leptospira soteropolitanensis TaxID=2950025 RepID=A0AAW5VIG4_9LEPT|nr:hypothetical protein [Leptospira soteropolitanensis]MCW7492394.1 hypothetical protein [Leptospira soteropolitanensis]MCW7499974.1 hypothetical protein [Leptospira soteropolitanensis]MCW7522226.1 hypothetical protein [Leptospira soteropolitanensis]MCW7526081.1 hypothetical protein [Leptospira soteropolitanensis]MCW7529807.1 hypothetical protein [Leptospira soteropolitanensis]